MKILYLITQADGGGAQNYTLTLAKHFHGAIAAGDEAKGLFDSAKDSLLTTYNLEHLKRDIHPWHDFMAIWEIRNLVKTLKPDIVHLNSSKAGFVGSLASIGLKTKVIFTAHGFVFLEPMVWVKKSFYMALEKLASEFRDFVITVSEKDKAVALALKLISPKKISCIYNGLPTINFLPTHEAQKTLKINPNKFIFGTVANFYKTKGLDILIEAVALLPETVKQQSQFVIVGNGSELENCKFQIEKLKLNNSFVLPGNIPNARSYLKAFNAFVLPSRKEGFPYALLEAMQAELPIVATDVGGVKEALGDAGILAPPENPQALATAIEKIITDKTLQNQLSQKAWERSKLFTEEKMLTETKQIYAKLLDV